MIQHGISGYPIFGQARIWSKEIKLSSGSVLKKLYTNIYIYTHIIMCIYFYIHVYVCIYAVSINLMYVIYVHSLNYSSLAPY